MSASFRLLQAAAIACALNAPVPVLAWHAQGLPSDPLDTRPPVLDIGAILPGDSEAVGCRASDASQIAQPLALADAVDWALCHNPRAQSSWAAIKMQAAALGEARAAYWPTLTASLSRLRNKTTYPDASLPGSTSDGRTSYVGAGWRLFDFGAREANREAAVQLLDAAIAGHDATLQRTLETTVGAYFDAITAEATLEAKNTARQLAQSSLLATQRREARGVSAQSDLLQAQSALSRAELESKRAEGDLRKAMALLTRAMALPAGLPMTLPPSTEFQGPANERTASYDLRELEQWLAEAQARHPALASARAQWLAAKAKTEAVRAEGLPTVELNANFYQNGYPNQGLQAVRSNITTVGITLTVPLFEGFARTYKMRRAQAQVEQSEAEWRDTEQQVLTEVVKAHADASSSLDNLQASENLFDAARASAKSSERRYAAGAADILELLSTQRLLAEAEQERVRCQADWRSARLRLLATAGQLGRMQLSLAKRKLR